LRVTGDDFELGVDEEVFDELFQPLGGLVDVLADFGDGVLIERSVGGGQQFRIGKDAAERRAHFVRQGHGNLAAEQGEFFFGLLADGARLPQPGVHGGVEIFHLERLGQVVVGPQFHAAPHAGGIGHARHQNERNGGRGRVLAKFGQGGEAHPGPVHVHVAKNEVRQVLVGLHKTFVAVRRLDHFKALLLQRPMDHFAQRGFVVNYQNFAHGVKVIAGRNVMPWVPAPPGRPGGLFFWGRPGVH
jgi:hypothetical protein